ncbi:XdhC family protein [Iningainema tapete]|uniref:XdhC family protein n=1 Tax=Iningainema tapete BLCC-T55 TaxID=2748662 RepID=A0A8J6XFS7_9CYAN|nr:XdhC/CoxI family protein [Iningainema tapete]MBD2772240.1 XdhC family protein [Iningainema tapete BLCC-T55]
MKELDDIVTAYEQVKNSCQTAALATVVKVKGSTYRRPGARMLMTSDGKMVGSISGGCLENDVFEQAKLVMTSFEPILLKYDPEVTEDIIWGLGLGCNGAVYVLIERLDGQIKFISECLNNRKLGVLATVFCVEGDVPVKVGNHLMFQDKVVESEIADSIITQAIITDAQVAIKNRKSKVRTYQLSTGSAEVLIEVIKPPTPLLIFGAGQDAIPVVSFAKELGWDVTVVDHRPAYVTQERFPIADNLVLSSAEAAHQHVSLDDRTVALIMTHNYFHDRELVKMLLPSAVRYIGILGPKSRTKELLEDLLAQEIVYSEEQLNRVYAPVGIDIGADTPVEIALSIVAEIQAVLAHRSGGFLRDRIGSIHQNVDETVETFRRNVST